MFFFDPLWVLLMAPPSIFMMYAQSKVKSAFAQHSAMEYNAR
jgi:hypothetical protein